MKNRRSISRFTIIWALLVSGIFSCDTASNVEDPALNYFIKYYGGDGDQTGIDMLALNDGSFLLLGNYKQDNFDTDIYLVHVDAVGDVIWERRYRQDIKDIANAKDIEPTADGNFIILSDVPSEYGPHTDISLIKISPDGVILGSKVFGTAANDYSKTVTPLDDGGFIVSGTTELTPDWNLDVPNPDVGDTFSYRFDQNLDKFSPWSPDILGFNSLMDVAVKAVQKPGGFYVFGHSTTNLSNNNPEGALGLFYFKRDSSGGQFAAYYPGNYIPENDTEVQFVERVAPELGDGFIVVGTSQDAFSKSDIFVAKLRNTLVMNKENDVPWDRILQFQMESGLGSRNVRGVSAASSLYGTLGYLVLGNEVRATGATNMWLTKIDQNGSILWSSTFGSEEEDDSGAAIVELPDGKIVILGTMGLADNQFKMALIKINPKGQLLK